MTRPSWRRRRVRSPLLFLTPAGVLFCIFSFYPLCRSAMLCFYNSAGPHHREFVGFNNFAFLVRDPLFWIAVFNTLIYTAVFIGLYIPLSLALALLLHRSKAWGKGFLRGAFFSTHLVGQVFVAILFALLLTPRHGWINRAVGIAFPSIGNEFDPKSNPLLALVTMIGLSLWLSVGYGMVYMQAALTTIDQDLYAAAEIDGASSSRQFWHITLPMLRPTLSLLTLAGTIAAFQLFELPYLFYHGPGPAFSGLTIVMYLYQQGFEVGNIGYASAIGWALTIILSILAAIQLSVTGLLRETA